MTVRQLIKILADAADLDAAITVSTNDDADLGPICFASAGYMYDTGERTTPRVVLTLASGDVAALAKLHALTRADGDPDTLEKLRDAGVIL